MDNKYNLGQITLYARIVTLKNETKAYSVAMYTYAGKMCQRPFKQEPGIESSIFIQLWNSPTVPDIEGTDHNGECNVSSPFLKYVVNDRGISGEGWAVFSEEKKEAPRVRGYLSLLLAELAVG